MANTVKAVFFDIGDTLGRYDPVTGTFKAFAGSAAMLAAARTQLGMRVGVITTLGNMNNAAGKALLHSAGLLQHIDPNGFVSERDNGGIAKPDPRIYRFAAEQVAVPVEQCLYVGENIVEVLGALSAGMQALLKPVPPGV
ncbi:HAD hydrolase-like protein [Duganella sp. FT92W]|uniref:HAD hydrolase-like protein n=1 Tax=Pseudoduganella rivuli TaxID=2666085 RepID=A0A7X2LTC5_9BURK|nr:HAD family hydrolase [Pseudoduganella rivuli]MRV71852.1 HAD hydrolase-like protein [Pseudoduganella rivuli]